MLLQASEHKDAWAEIEAEPGDVAQASECIDAWAETYTEPGDVPQASECIDAWQGPCLIMNKHNIIKQIWELLFSKDGTHKYAQVTHWLSFQNILCPTESQGENIHNTQPYPERKAGGTVWFLKLSHSGAALCLPFRVWKMKKPMSLYGHYKQGNIIVIE